jgi:hypothetical protein
MAGSVRSASVNTWEERNRSRTVSSANSAQRAVSPPVRGPRLTATLMTFWSPETRCDQLTRELKFQPLTCEKVVEIANEICGLGVRLKEQKDKSAKNRKGLDQPGYLSFWASLKIAAEACDTIQRAQSWVKKAKSLDREIEERDPRIVALLDGILKAPS